MVKVLKVILVFSFLTLLFGNQVFAQAPSPPTLIYPLNSDSPIWAGMIEFEWTNTGANYYHYLINLPDGTSKEGVITSTVVRFYDLKLGNYSWAVRSCDDAAGSSCGAWSSVPPEVFEIGSAPPKLLKGLVPCGRLYDNPGTEIIESKPCEFADIFLLFKLVLDFLLWRVGPIILVLLVLAVGITSYFALGSPSTIAQVKSILRTAIVGYGIIFLAWLIVNLFLVILGYRIGIFGRWWEIRF
ncbi:MAG: pilin [Candidatus Paceibacterales bacterium]